MLFALAGSTPTNAQLNVDSLTQLLQRTTKPLAHLDLLRTLGETGDVELLGTCARATIRYADSLMITHPPDTFQVLDRKAYGYWMLGSHHQRSGRMDSTTACARRAAGLWKKIGDLRQAAVANNFLAADLMDRGEVTEAVKILKETLATNEVLKDSAGMAGNHCILGGAYSACGDYPKALDHYQLALALGQAGFDPDVIGQCLSGIGGIYYIQSGPDTAIYFYQLAAEAFARTHWPQRSAGPLANIARAHIIAKNYAAALKVCEEGLELFGTERDHPATADLYLTMSQVYQAMGDLERSIECGEHALAVNDPGSVNLQVTILLEIGRSWFVKGVHPHALKNAEQALALIGSFELDLTLQHHAAALLADIYTKTGPAEKALFYYKESIIYADSINNESIRRKLVVLELRKQEVADSSRAAGARAVQQVAHQQEMFGEQRTKRNFMLAGLGVLVIAGGLFVRLRLTRRAKRVVEGHLVRSDSLLNNILPSDVAEELKHKGEAQARDFDNVSILFTDFKGFTEMSEQLSAQELVAEINTCFKAFDGIIGKHGVEKIKTIGDAYMAAGGLSLPTDRSSLNTVLAAIEMQAFMKHYTAERIARNKPAFTMRVGIHTGPVVAGIVGVKKFQYDIWGDTVNIASRMESSGKVGQVNISEATYALVRNGTGLSFTPRGKVQAKGKGELEMYFVQREIEGAAAIFVE